MHDKCNTINRVRSRSYIAIVLLLVGLVATPSRLVAEEGVACFSSLAKDLGNVPQNSVVRQSFSFRNTGNGPLKILSVQTNCACSEIGKRKTEYAPGEEGDISIELQVGNRYGPLSAMAFVRTDAVTSPVALLKITGNVVGDLEFYPNAIRFPSVLVGESGETRKVEIRSPLRDIQIVSARSDSSAFRVRRVRESETYLSGAYEYEIEHCDTSKVGVIHSFLRIVIRDEKSSENTFLIPIRAEVSPLCLIGGSGGRLGILKKNVLYTESVPFSLKKQGMHLDFISPEAIGTDIKIQVSPVGLASGFIDVAITPNQTGVLDRTVRFTLLERNKTVGSVDLQIQAWVTE